MDTQAVTNMAGAQSSGAVPVGGQGAWAVGVMMFEVVMNEQPFDEYPVYGYQVRTPLRVCGIYLQLWPSGICM